MDTRLYFFLVLLQVSVSESGVKGPCRRWYRSCEHRPMEESWQCTSVEEYARHNTRGCPVYTMDDTTNTPPPTSPPPPQGRCLLVNGVCQFDTSSTLQCAFRQSQAGGCRYRCVEDDRADIPTSNCSSSRYPPPDTLCVPIDGQCQEYNPCRFWKGFCSGPYRCGTLDDYYRFRFGPQPACGQPPAGFVEPEPPGECVLLNNTCSWSNCHGHLDICRSNWMCDTAYDAAVYLAEPRPPCPYPPPSTPPPNPPGTCAFNLTMNMCNFTTRVKNTGSLQCMFGGLGCDSPEFKCVVDMTDPTSPHSVCSRRCGFNNGGCTRNQLCVERAFCVNCSTSEDGVMEGTCLNAGTALCPSGASQCDGKTKYCAVSKVSGAPYCAGSCLRDNGGCGPGRVCLTVRESGCDATSSSNDCPVVNQCHLVSDLSEGVCPVGQERSGRCSLGCEDYQSDTPTSSSSGTCDGCSCPVGLVRFRDRCVDPRECYSLFMDPPRFNPLPLSEDEVLLLVKTPTARGVFVSEHKNFVMSLQSYLNTSGHDDITASLHGYTGSRPLQVAVLLSGRGMCEEKAIRLVELVRAGAGNLSLVVVDVSVIDAPRLTSGRGRYHPVIIALLVLSGLLVVLAVVVTAYFILRIKKKKRRPRMTKTRACNEVTVIQSGDVKGAGDNGYKYSELYGTETFMWEESQEDEDGVDDKKLPEEKKSPE